VTSGLNDDSEYAALSELFIRGLTVDGASITVVGRMGHSLVSSSGARAVELERLQFGLGEGPHWEALSTGRPVLVPDVRTADADRWPAFSSQIADSAVVGVFSFPMRIGAAVVGVVDLSRDREGGLNERQVERAIAMTRAVTLSAVRLATNDAHSDGASGSIQGLRREVHQATGMLVAQLDVTATDAFARLRAFAYAHDRPVEDVAADVVARRLDLTDGTP